jgi:hypothetical protein
MCTLHLWGFGSLQTRRTVGNRASASQPTTTKSHARNATFGGKKTRSLAEVRVRFSNATGACVLTSNENDGIADMPGSTCGMASSSRGVSYLGIGVSMRMCVRPSVGLNPAMLRSRGTVASRDNGVRYTRGVKASGAAHGMMTGHKVCSNREQHRSSQINITISPALVRVLTLQQSDPFHAGIT